MQPIDFCSEPAGNFRSVKQMAEIRLAVGKDLQVPTLFGASCGNDRATEWGAHANLVTIFRHAPRDAFALDVLDERGKFHGVGTTNQVLGKFIEPNGIGAIPSGADPCVAAMVEQLVGVADADILGGHVGRQGSKLGVVHAH